MSTFLSILKLVPEAFHICLSKTFPIGNLKTQTSGKDVQQTHEMKKLNRLTLLPHTAVTGVITYTKSAEGEGKPIFQCHPVEKPFREWRRSNALLLSLGVWE